MAAGRAQTLLSYMDEGEKEIFKRHRMLFIEVSRRLVRPLFQRPDSLYNPIQRIRPWRQNLLCIHRGIPKHDPGLILRQSIEFQPLLKTFPVSPDRRSAPLIEAFTAPFFIIPIQRRGYTLTEAFEKRYGPGNDIGQVKSTQQRYSRISVSTKNGWPTPYFYRESAIRITECLDTSI